jgi:hypothetical protein
MMTLEYAVELVREIRGLERLEAVITQNATTGPEWKFALIAIADRLRWDRYCAGLEPDVIAAAEEALAAGADAPGPAPAAMPDSPGRRMTIH